MRLRAAAMDILTSTFLVCREYRIVLEYLLHTYGARG